MQIKCIKCGTVTEAAGVDFEVVNFGCPNCKKVTSYEKVPEGAIVDDLSNNRPAPALSVGQKGMLKGKEYTVTAIIVKKVDPIYFWTEYILTSADNEWLYLSETEGHWILLHEVEDRYDVEDYPQTLVYDDIHMNIYDHSNTRIISAQGFFSYELPNGRVKMIEYINPPYIFSIEIDRNEASFFGEHISKGDVKKAFNVKSMPYKAGVGIVQPYLINIRKMAITFCCVAVLILVSHLIIYSGRQSTTVVKEALSFSESDGKDFVTKPFTLEGGSAPLTISVHSDVNNSWASVQVALINEKTSDEVYANKDIEYYHGYESGEHWSEGDTNENFNICGVSAGTYHLVITPQKAPEDANNNFISVEAEWNKPSVWNMVIPIIIMLVVTVVCYYLGVYFEQRRWADSSYSPYSST
ncbi:DUF4178 domain-containing protein [Flavobacterium suzhouense]|uniref:DUF4178 domain-containing protein n=1 Tax=Flavobacterium suzhouense TaxID=1529638 RepID=A0ABW5NSK3_9FLAO